jgi:hypothetical protein
MPAQRDSDREGNVDHQIAGSRRDPGKRDELPRQQCRHSLPSWALEDSRTAHECCPLASQQTVLASTQQGSVAAYEVKVPSC